jgi:hypothetical protein
MRAHTRRTHDRPVHRPTPALAVVLAAAGVLVAAGPAAADGSLVPGATQTSVVAVPDGWAADADAIDVVVDELVQLENDCMEPEKRAGDDCTDAAGELGDKLLATVAWGVEDDGCRPKVDMAPLDLAGVDGTRFDSTRFERVAGVDCLVIELAFPHGDSDNLAQSDSLTFALAAVAEEVPGEVAGTRQPEDRVSSPTAPTDGGSGTESQGPVDPLSDSAVSPGNAGEHAAAGRGARGGTGAPPAEAAAAVEDRGAAGPMVGRVDAQVSVAADGVSVETRAAESSLPGLALAGSSLLLGAIALGWVAFVLVRRRRTDVAA